MESKIIDLVSDYETDTFTPVVDTVPKVPTVSVEVQNVVVDLVSTSDKDSVKNEANTPSIVDADRKLTWCHVLKLTVTFCKLSLKKEETRLKLLQ